MKYTNNYTVLKDIMKSAYQLVLNIIFVNIGDIVHVLKSSKKFKLLGEVLEYLYQSAPRFNTKTHEQVCDKFTYIDNIIRTIYKNEKKHICKEIKRDVWLMCNNFHIDPDQFDFYYFAALFIIALERSISEDAMNIFAQLDSNIQADLERFTYMFFQAISQEEFQGLFFNHVEDVYGVNRSEDDLVSVLHKDNYSFFLDSPDFNLNDLLTPYLKPIEGVRYPVILTANGVFIVKDNKTFRIGPNTMMEKYPRLFSPRARQIASYYPKQKIIARWVPYFSYFAKYNGSLPEHIYESFFDEFRLPYHVEDLSLLDGCQPFMTFRPDDEHLQHWFIDHFTVFTDLPQLEDSTEDDEDIEEIIVQ